MKRQPEGAPRPASYTHVIALGGDSIDLSKPTDPSVRACQLYVISDGPDAGRIEMDVIERGADRRVVMTEAEAEALAHVFRNINDPGSHRIAHALLDAAHHARQTQGRESVRTDIGTLK